MCYSKDMKKIIIILISLILGSVISEAAIFTYVDDGGKTWYVDRTSAVPQKYQNQISQSKTVSLSGSSGSTQNSGGAEQNPVVDPRTVEIFIDPQDQVCMALEEFLRLHNLPYKRYDIVSDPSARSLYDMIGLNNIPLVRIGTSVLVGFNPEQILGEIERAR